MAMVQKMIYMNKQIKNLGPNYIFVIHITVGKKAVENLIGIVRRFYPKKTDWKFVYQWEW